MLFAPTFPLPLGRRNSHAHIVGEDERLAGRPVAEGEAQRRAALRRLDLGEVVYPLPTRTLNFGRSVLG